MTKYVVALILLVVALTGGIVACVNFTSATSPDASHFACVYKGGPFDSKGFEKAVPPGAGRTHINVGGTAIMVPASVRQYDKSDGLPDVNVTVRGIPMTFSPVVNFTISTVMNPDGKPAGCDLVEQHLRPLNATDFDADQSRWAAQFLNIRMAGVVRDVAPKVLQGQDPTALAQNIDGTRDAAATAFGAELSRGMSAQLGGSFFCGPAYKYGQPAEACGTMNVVLSEPTLAADDAALIAKPQRAKTEADNDIAVAREAARKAAEVADQLTTQAESAARAADAKSQIAEQEGRVVAVDAANTYAWCTYLANLGQDCALVKAAESGDFPDVYTPGGTPPVVAVTPPTTAAP